MCHFIKSLSLVMNNIVVAHVIMLIASHPDDNFGCLLSAVRYLIYDAAL